MEKSFSNSSRSEAGPEVKTVLMTALICGHKFIYGSNMTPVVNCPVQTIAEVQNQGNGSKSVL